MIVLVLLLLLLLIVRLGDTRRENTREGFGSGALVQLYSKGPQDEYLTADAERYRCPCDPAWIGYWPTPWNIPTRYRNYRYDLRGYPPPALIYNPYLWR